MKVGDLVVLINMYPGCNATPYVHIGMVGEITGSSWLVDHTWIVKFCGRADEIHCMEAHLRKIDPPQACDADFDWRRVGEDVRA